MTFSPEVLPGLLIVALEMLALAAVGYVVARVALRQQYAPLALAQGLVIGPAIWGLVANFLFYLLPGPTGALGAWLVTLAFGAWLVWRTPNAWRMPPREVAGFAVAVLVISWVSLAARQLLNTPDPSLRLGLTASIQAGNWPPALPWNPWQPVPYHYGGNLLAALLAPPVGPDLAFTTELLGAYAWTSLAMIVGTTLRQRGGWISYSTLTPLLLTAGAWTLVFSEAPAVLQLPVPTSFTEPGILTSLGEVYWPAQEWPWKSPEPQASPPNIWKPFFTLGYALVFTVLERATASERSFAMVAPLTLAALVGFLGLLEETLALTTLGVWGVAEVARVLTARPTRVNEFGAVKRAVMGPVAATVLLAIGGGVISGLLAGSAGRDLVIIWADDPNSRRLLGSVEPLPDGLSLLGLGPLAVTATVLFLAWRDRLVLALAAVGGVFILATLTLHYRETHDLVRLDGHARNLGLLALLVALAARLSTLRNHWRYASASLVVGLVAWPTLVAPVRIIGKGLEHGVHLQNAQPGQEEFDKDFLGVGRGSLRPFAPKAISAYVRDHTQPDDRILSPQPQLVSVATGRPNASGFAGLLHLNAQTGPEYEDAIRYLEPAAIQRLGYAYIHATEEWVATLPSYAKRWLDDPELFKLLIRDGTDALYRVQPAFLRLAQEPARGSFEALRKAVPSSASVFIADIQQPLDRIRLTSVLRHARLHGAPHTSGLHLLTDIQVKPLGSVHPDVLVLPRELPLEIGVQRLPTIWWNDRYVAYATRSSIGSAIAPPPRPAGDFSIRLADVQVANDRVSFTATFLDRAADQWTGQDWLVIEMEKTPWAWLARLEEEGHVLEGALWFAGQAIPVTTVITKSYEFNALAGNLAVRNEASDLVPISASGDGLTPGIWSLAVRLQHEHLQAAIIPLIEVAISESGKVAYTVYPGPREAAVKPCPERVRDTDSCRKLTLNSQTPPAN